MLIQHYVFIDSSDAGYDGVFMNVGADTEYEIKFNGSEPILHFTFGTLESAKCSILCF